MPECDVRVERSYCRICTAMCGIVVEVEGEQVVRVRGDRDHPVTHGYMCPKGRALPKMHHHQKRLEHPLLRVGGSLQPTSWESCLDGLATELRRIIAQHGPAAVGIFFGSGVGMDAAGYRMAQALQAALGTPARFSPLTIDGTAKTLVASLVGGFPGFSPRPDYDNVNLVIYVGINPMVSHGHTIAMPNPAVTIRTTAQRGEVWVIDPLQTETSAFASAHLAPRPGTDYAILAYLVRELLSDGADTDVLQRSTVGVDVLRRAVEPFILERVADLTGLPAEQLTTLLSSVRRAGRLAVETGTGVTMSVAANLTQWLAWVLMIITGSMNRRGGVWFHPGFINQLDGGELPIITEIFGPGPKSRPELRSIVGDWPCAALPDENQCRQHSRLPESGRQSHPLISRRERLAAGVTATRSVCHPGNHRERDDGTIDACFADQGPARAAGPGTVGFSEPPSQRAIYSRHSQSCRRAARDVVDTCQLMRRSGHEPPGCPAADVAGSAADNAMLAPVAAYARCGFTDLTEKRYVETTHEFPARWVDAHVERLGGWRLAPPSLVEQLTAVREAHERDRGRAGSLSSTPVVSDATERTIPLSGLSRRCVAPSRGCRPPPVLIGRTAGARCSARGEIVGTAHVDPAIRPGVVSVPHGHEHANVNLLTSTQDVDPLTGMTHYSGIQAQRASHSRQPGRNRDKYDTTTSSTSRRGHRSQRRRRKAAAKALAAQGWHELSRRGATPIGPPWPRRRSVRQPRTVRK